MGSQQAQRLSLETDRFELRERLGEGGAGVVYEAFDREHGRTVALKLLPEMSAEDIGRLKHEFRALADVVHPNLVRLHELCVEGAQWFFTMERLSGCTFLEYVRQGDSRPPPELAELETRKAGAVRPADNPAADPAALPRESGRPREPELRAALLQLARAVTAIHAAGKLHCDLKPSNVLVTPEGRVVVLDFGLVTDARASARKSEPDQSVSGTPAYMAPEQAAGGRVSEASDWYAVGVMLYEALTGRLPFTGSAHDMMRQKQVADPPPPELLASDLPEDLCALCRALLSRRPEDRPGGAEVLARLGDEPAAPELAHGSSIPPAHRSAPLVGREQELARLERAFAQARRREPVTVYVHGSPGIGKTRLVQEFLSRAAREGAVVLAGRCYERERLPFKAFDSIIDALSAYLIRLGDAGAALLPRDVHSLARLFPALRRVPCIERAPLPTFEVPDPRELRRRAFAAVKELLARIADRAPLVVHIDDLHWGDADSASLLFDLLAPPDPPAMLFVAGFRSEDAERSAFLRTLLARHPPGAAHAAVQDLPLSPLSPDESLRLVHAFAAALPEGDARAAAQAEVIAREGEGNPFFVAQLVHHLALRREPANTNAAPEAAPAERRAGVVTLEQVLRERLSYLPAPALALLETLCVVGRPLPRDLALEAAGLGRGEGADAALALLRAGAWVRSQGPRKDDAVECFHDRVREVVAQTLPPERLRARHARVALTLEHGGRASPVDLVEHFRAAGQHDRAAHYARRAGDQARDALAFDEAARFYELALQFGDHDAPARLALQVQLGEALANAGRGAQAAQVYEQAARGADPERALELHRRAAEHWLVSGRFDEGLAALREVLAAIDMRLARTPRRALWSMLAQRARVKLRGLSWTWRAQDEVPERELMRIDTCWAVATKLATVDTIRAADFQARHLLLALSAGEPYRVARALAVEAGFAATSGEPGRARAQTLGAVARRLALELEDRHPHALGLSMTMAGMSAYLMGEWANALRECDEAERILLERCTGVQWELSNARRFALSSLGFLGRISELGRRAFKLLADARERGNLYMETDLRTRLLTWAWLAQGRPDTAAAEARDALARWTQQGFHLQHYNHLLGMTHCDLYRGDAASAVERLDATWPELESSLLLRIRALRAEILHARGRALLAHERATAQHRARAARLARKLHAESMPWTQALAALLDAGVHAREGDLERSRARLARALGGFDASGMALYAAAARDRLGALLGGDEGKEQRKRAHAFYAEQGIADAAAFTRLLAPGFD